MSPFTRWTHAHTGAVGFAGGLILDRHVLYVFLLGAILGGLTVYASRTLRAVGKGAARQAAELHRLAVDRVQAEIDRKRAVADKARAETAHRIRRAAEQAELERKAYIQGAIDGQP